MAVHAHPGAALPIQHRAGRRMSARYELAHLGLRQAVSAHSLPWFLLVQLLLVAGGRR